MVYDCGEKSLKVRSQKKVDKGKRNRIISLMFTKNSIWFRLEQCGLQIDTAPAGEERSYHLR